MKIMLSAFFAVIAVLGFAAPTQSFSPMPIIVTQAPMREIVFRYADDKLWSYMRLGLNYLESPRPLSPPEAVSPGYVHPDGRGFGAYGFSPEAYEDVQRLYPFFREYAWEEVLGSSRLYDLANRAFADWVLRNVLEDLSSGASREEVFDAVHRAWNLGISGYKRGRHVVRSRVIRAEEFKALAAFNGIFTTQE